MINYAFNLTQRCIVNSKVHQLSIGARRYEYNDTMKRHIIRAIFGTNYERGVYSQVN